MGHLQDCPRSEPLTGWRYWHLGVDPRGPLRSLSQRGFVWSPNRELVARCADRPGQAFGDHGDTLDDHQAPAGDCGCGIHASVDLASLQSQALCLRPLPLVVGHVGLWGRVITEERADGHGQDLRGQFAVPVRLWVVPETLVGGTAAMAVSQLEAYGVVVGTMALDEAVGEASGTILRHLSMSAATPQG